MFFPKLKHLCSYSGVNKFVVERLDEWLAAQPEMSYEYLNPIEFINEAKLNKKMALILFALAAKIDLFKEFNEEPILRIKYILNCPCCDSHICTYYNNKDIPNYYIECFEENCDQFNPSFHPEKIEIYYELLDAPIVKEDSILEVYEKVPSPPLLAGDKDFLATLWDIEEGSFRNK